MIIVIATNQYGNEAKATISRSLMDRFMDLIKRECNQSIQQEEIASTMCICEH